MAKLELGELVALENTTGKYLEVMGTTSSEIVVVGCGGKTAVLPISVAPTAEAKDIIYLTTDNEISNIEKFKNAMKKAAEKTNTQQNSPKGSTRPLDTSYNTRSL